MILGTDLGAVKLLNLRGLIDVFSTISAILTTGFKAALYTEYGDALTAGIVEDLTTVDFVSSVGGATSRVRNSTDSADVTLTPAVIESPAGTYQFQYTAQTSGDQIILKPVANGFDFSAVEANVITSL